MKGGENMKKIEVDVLYLERLFAYIEALEEGKINLEAIKKFKEKYGVSTVEDYMKQIGILTK
jgi:hypothetical protein